MANTLGSDERLAVGESRTSENGQYRLAMQPDGNLVLYRTPDDAPLWAAKTDGRGGTSAVMQEDGNLVIDGDAGAVWASDTGGHPGATLAVQDDGNVVIYEAGTALWATETSVSTTAESSVSEAASTDGTVVGNSLARVYITKEGDHLEELAAYFYGDPAQQQRLRDDNPAMVNWSGPLPAGTRLAVPEDAARGDTVAGSSPT